MRSVLWYLLTSKVDPRLDPLRFPRYIGTRRTAVGIDGTGGVPFQPISITIFTGRTNPMNLGGNQGMGRFRLHPLCIYGAGVRPGRIKERRKRDDDFLGQPGFH